MGSLIRARCCYVNFFFKKKFTFCSRTDSHPDAWVGASEPYIIIRGVARVRAYV